MDPVTPIDPWARRRGPRRRIRASRVIAGILIALIAIVCTVGVDLYTDALWFRSVGYLPVFSTVLLLQVGLFFAGFLIFGAAFLASVFVSRKLAYQFEGFGTSETEGMWAFVARVGARSLEQMAYQRAINGGILLLGAFLAIIMGLVAAGQWDQALRFMNQRSFGVTDPAFGLDVSFYVFTLPFLRFVHSWLLGSVILIITTSLAVYAVVSAYELGVSLERAAFQLPRPFKAHLAVLLATLTLLLAANHVLDVYELVYSTRGSAYGAGYADTHAQAPGLWIMASAALLATGLIIASIWQRGWRPAVIGVMLWGASALVFGLVIPNAMEQFDVKPNQLERERPYIENNIALTLEAYGLDNIQEVLFQAEDAVTPEDARASADTIQNVRLWDHRPLRETFNQIQSIRTYYTFDDVDVDRYNLRGAYRQVMVSPRELSIDGLAAQARTWVNQRLKFTHGYGVTMSLVSSVAEEGRPSLVVQDVPPVGDIPITRPEIYYGQRPSSYVILKTAESEFDFPRGEDNAQTRYQGETGVNIGAIVDRIAYAIRFRDGNLLLSSSLGPESTIVYRRSLRERIQRIAPYLMLDRDPYIVVADGRLVWMQDAYTTSSSYPYSQPMLWRYPGFAGAWLNYVRNSVKITMDAYDGTVTFYTEDPEDPILAAYQSAFPTLYHPISEMPAALQEHIRYPEDLFTIQTSIYQTYHMTDPAVFYNREDQWTNAKEKFYAQEQLVDPYYVITRLEGETQNEFVLMLPFTPRGKDNMIAWLAARSDVPNYGKLLVYKFPKDKLVYGPFQVEGRIDQEPSISSQFTLWNQTGSRIIRGNMLVIPIGHSNLYVEPIYLQAENGPIPELKRVILSTGNRLVMEPTLEEAVAKLFGAPSAQAINPSGTAPPAGAQPATGTASPDVAAIIASARGHFDRSQEALRNGDWAKYGEEQRALEADLRSLAEQANR